MSSLATTPHGLLRFVCPRCGDDVAERWYGPCDSCRSALQAAVVGTAHDVIAVPYEPPMHVMPNAVGMKD